MDCAFPETVSKSGSLKLAPRKSSSHKQSAIATMASFSIEVSGERQAQPFDSEERVDIQRLSLGIYETNVWTSKVCDSVGLSLLRARYGMLSRKASLVNIKFAKRAGARVPEVALCGR
jgi:hypothetical protein